MSDSRDTRENEAGLEEVRERARQFWGEFYGTGAEYADERSLDFTVAFAQSEREAEMELCCKDVCQSCRTPKHWSPAEKDEFGDWIHRSSGAGDVNAEIACEASAIRERCGCQRKKTEHGGGDGK